VTDLVDMVADYGAVPDAKWVITTFTLHSGTKILTASSPLWFPADVGRKILVPPLPFGSVFISGIASYASPTQVVLADNSPYEYDAYEAILAWGTDSTPMFQSFKDDWQGYSGIILTIPPGIYLIAAGNFGGLWDGIREITVNATGATLAGGMFQVQAAAQYQLAGYSSFTATVTAGATSVTLLTPAETSKFTVGQWAMMTGFDMQLYGYPTNNGQLEYHRIASIDAGTGVVTFETPLVEGYKSTWPLYADEILPPLFPNQRMGGPATLYVMHPNFEHTCVLNGLAIAQHAQYGVSGLDITFNDCTFEGVGQLGPHPTMAHRVIFNDCHAPGVLLEIDKLVDLIEVNGGTWDVLNYQSANSIRETILDNVTVLTSIVGSPWKLTIRNGCNIAYYQCATVFFGFANELVVSDSVISSWSSGAIGTSHRTLDGGTQDGIDKDCTMAGGVITVPAAMRAHLSIAQWAIEGGRMFFNDTAVGMVGAFTITDVTESGPFGDVLVHTDWTGNSGGFPARSYGSNGMWLQTHPAPLCTFTNVTGCIEVEDFSRAPAGAPMWSYTKRTYTGLTGSGPYINLTGRIRRIRIDVTVPYTGVAPTLTVNIFPGWTNDMDGAGTVSLAFDVNLRTAGVRQLDTDDGYPALWTGTQSGDTMPVPGLAADRWIAGLHFVSQNVVNLALESPAVWPEYSVEIITDQLIEAPPIVPEPPEATAQAVFWLNYVPVYVAPPSITSPATASVNENSTLAHALAADLAVTWSIVGGADSAKFEISGATLRWTGDGTKDFESPDDADTNNTYTVTVRATGAGGTADQNVTVTVLDIDDTAPGITSPNTSSVDEDLTLAHALTATETVTWSIVGGADAAGFEISGSTLRWIGDGVQDYDAPADADADNAYIVTVRATDTSGNTTDQTVTVTVLEVSGAITGETTSVTDTLVTGTVASPDTLLLPYDFT
jgi:hypothetical protein